MRFLGILVALCLLAALATLGVRSLFTSVGSAKHTRYEPVDVPPQEVSPRHQKEREEYERRERVRDGAESVARSIWSRHFMCGICGLVGDNDPVLLDRMLDRLVHRGPDDEGTHHDAGVAFGVRRLRVIDPTGGHQPVRNETGSVWAVLNGEIYNYRELRRELIKKGHRFQSDCDTEVLVHLYEEEGPEAVYRLRGMFAYAIWDRERDLVLLVRDRLGIKPLYYSVQPGKAGAAHRVLFSSELPSLLEGLPNWTIRPQAIADFLSLLYVPGPDTIVEGCLSAPTGGSSQDCTGSVGVLALLSSGRRGPVSWLSLRRATNERAF